MSTMDLQSYPDLDPAANLALGSLNFGRFMLKNLLHDVKPDQLYAKPSGFKNDIATLVLHIGAIEVRFSHLIQGRTLPSDLAAAYYLDQPQSPLPAVSGETLAGLQEKLDASFEHVYAALRGLTADDWTRLVPAGNDRFYSVQWMVGLLPMHQLLHIGQMQMLLRVLQA